MPRGRMMRAAATASMVSSARTNRAVRKNIEGQEEPQQSQPAPVAEEPAQVAAAAPADDTSAQLEQLAKLHSEGVLTDEEFAAKKKQLLGI